MYYQDEWPLGPDGRPFDGKRLMDLMRQEASPFHLFWDVKLLIEEIEEELHTQVTDIPMVDEGSTNIGIHLKTSDRPDLVARLAREDVNVPDWHGDPVEMQVSGAHCEATIYDMLDSEPAIRVSRLLYYCVPMQYPGPKLFNPRDLNGRRLFVFERATGCNNVWESLGANRKLSLLGQLACIRAALFSYNPPRQFSIDNLHGRLFNPKPKYFLTAVSPTREFWIYVLKSKIRATIGNKGDIIGWPDGKEVVGSIALAAKHSLIRAIPYIMPLEDSSSSLYRFVLEHGNFGIHHTSIAIDANLDPQVTSLYDWQEACIVPALLSDPEVRVIPIDLIAGDLGEACITRAPAISTATDREEYTAWAEHYFQQLYAQAPDYKKAIEAGKDARHLWFALRGWDFSGAEAFFGSLGEWAEDKIREFDNVDEGKE